jgi:hypothetical protein
VINDSINENGLKPETKEILTTFIPPNSSDLVVFKLMDRFENCSIKLINFAYNSFNTEAQKNHIEVIILKSIYKIDKFPI